MIMRKEKKENLKFSVKAITFMLVALTLSTLYLLWLGC